jgi:hypothetical protein
MTGAKASPMTRPCAVCQTSFQPRRSDALFCSGPCRQAAYRYRQNGPDLQIARSAFPVDAERAELVAAGAISWLNERSVPLGIYFTRTMRDFDIRDAFPGAADLAEKYDQGPVGQYLRLLKAVGWFSPSPRVREVLVERVMLERNAEVEEANERWEGRSLWEDVEGYEAVLDEMLRGKRDHRDIALEWPSEWQNGVRIPIINPHKR